MGTMLHCGPQVSIYELLDVENLVVKWLPLTLGDSTWRWVPHLRIILTTRSLLSKTDQGDVDVGERPYVGAQIYSNDAGAQFEECEIGRFNVLHFGGLPSPYLAAWMDGTRRFLCRNLLGL